MDIEYLIECLIIYFIVFIIFQVIKVILKFEMNGFIEFVILFIAAIHIRERIDGFTSKNNVEPTQQMEENIKIIQQYDCPSEYGRHRLCGIVENNTSRKRDAWIYVHYYDADGIKITYEYTIVSSIEPHGKSKFQTASYYEEEPFDYYKVELKVMK